MKTLTMPVCPIRGSRDTIGHGRYETVHNETRSLHARMTREIESDRSAPTRAASPSGAAKITSRNGVVRFRAFRLKCV